MTGIRHWLKEGKSLEGLIGSINETEKAETWEKIGYCYCRASRQAGDSDKFREIRRLAGEAFMNAAALFEEEPDPDSGRSSRCMAAADHALSWLETDTLRRLEILDTCRTYAEAALEAFKEADDELNYGKTCSDLLVYLSERSSLTSGQIEKQYLAEDGLRYGDEALNILTKLDDKEELLRVLPELSLHHWYVANTSEQPEEREEMAHKSLEFAEKSVALTEMVDDPYLAGMAQWAAAMSTLFFTGQIELALEHGKEMLRQATESGDNYMKGAANYVLAYITDWMARGEENPDDKRQRCQEVIKYSGDAIRNLQLVLQDAMIAEAYLFYSQRYSTLSSDLATSRTEKLSLSRRAIEAGRKGLEHAVRSGSPDALAPISHALSKALHSSSRQESKKDKKIALLRESLKLREEYIRIVTDNFPSNTWILGVGKAYSGQLKADLARLGGPEGRAAEQLQRAIEDMDDGVLHCTDWISTRPSPSMIIIVAGFEEWLGRTLEELYVLTEDENILRKANQVYEDAAERFRDVDLLSRVAESFWKIALNHDRLNEFREASLNFDKAYREYRATARGMPSFKDFFTDYADYMRAWSEIEDAKIAHEERDHINAMKKYRGAANRLKRTKSWGYLSPNFQAWSSLEQAEDLSRRDRTANAITAFNRAAEHFRDSKNSLRISSGTIESRDQVRLIERLIAASEQREQYCLGRVAIEEAKDLDQKGKHGEASERYGWAASKFQELADAGPERIRKELMPISYLCLAWQKMLMAEATSSSQSFIEAAELFEKVKDLTLDESQGLLSLAHSNFCRALAAGTEYEITRDNEKYAAAKKYMEIAASSYMKSGYQMAAEYANGTQRLLDAYVLIESAKMETDPVKTARYCAMAEKVLQYSAEAFKKASHPEKIEQIKQLLLKIKEERELALVLGDIMGAPAVVSSTESFATLSLSEEQAVGLDSFEGTNIQATLVCEFTEIRAGEDFHLEMHIVNVGREIIQLAAVEEILPSGFEMVLHPRYCTIQETRMNLKAKRLDPMKTEEINLVMRSFAQGSFTVKPTLEFVDESGKELSIEPEPISIVIVEVALTGRVQTGYSDLDKLLLGGLPENYSVILTSPVCDERDLLVDRFLEAGAKRGDTTLHITSSSGRVGFIREEGPESFLFVCNPRLGEAIKNAPNIFKIKSVENLTEINIALARAFRTLDDAQGSKTACIEVVSDVLLHHHAVQTRRWLGELISELKAKGFTTLATMNPLMHVPEDTEAVLGLFEGQIEISHDERDASLRLLRVERMLNQEYLESNLLLRRERLLRYGEPEKALTVGRIATGNLDLDRLLGGGFPGKFSVIMTSSPCDEKDGLVKRFLESGIKKGQAVFFITMDPGRVEKLAEEHPTNFQLFICNPQADLMVKNLPNVTKLTGIVNLTNINLALVNAFRRLEEPQTEPRRICVDVVSDILLQHQAVTTKRWLSELLPVLRSKGFTTLAVINPQMHAQEDMEAVLGLFEGEIDIHERRVRKTQQKFLSVKRMYDQEFVEEELSLKRIKESPAAASKRLV